MSEINYYRKYLKYKQKYLILKGSGECKNPNNDKDCDTYCTNREENLKCKRNVKNTFIIETINVGISRDTDKILMPYVINYLIKKKKI